MPTTLGMASLEAAYPHVLGHETVGTIVEVGADVTRVAVGQRVVVDPGVPCMQCEWCFRDDINLCPNVRFHGTPPVDGTFKQFFCHPATWVMKLPDGLSDDEGVVLESLSVADLTDG